MTETISRYAERWSVMQAIVGLVVIAGFFFLVFCWMFYPPKTSDAGILAILNILTGAASALAGAVVNFYFGSSQGSKDKDETTKLATQTAAVATASMDRTVTSPVSITPPTPSTTTIETPGRGGRKGGRGD